MKSINRAEIVGSLVYYEESGKNPNVIKGTLRYFTGRKKGKPYENIRFICSDHAASTIKKLTLHTSIRIKGKLREDGVVMVEKVSLASSSEKQTENAKNRLGYMPEDQLPW